MVFHAAKFVQFLPFSKCHSNFLMFRLPFVDDILVLVDGSCLKMSLLGQIRCWQRDARTPSNRSSRAGLGWSGKGSGAGFLEDRRSEKSLEG